MTISRCRWRGFVRHQAIMAVVWDLQTVGLVYRIDWRAKSMRGKAPGWKLTTADVVVSTQGAWRKKEKLISNNIVFNVCKRTQILGSVAQSGDIGVLGMGRSICWGGLVEEAAEPWILHQLFYHKTSKSETFFPHYILIYANWLTPEEQNQSSGRFSSSRDRSAGNFCLPFQRLRDKVERIWSDLISSYNRPVLNTAR